MKKTMLILLVIILSGCSMEASLISFQNDSVVNFNGLRMSKAIFDYPILIGDHTEYQTILPGAYLIQYLDNDDNWVPFDSRTYWYISSAAVFTFVISQGQYENYSIARVFE